MPEAPCKPNTVTATMPNRADSQITNLVCDALAGSQRRATATTKVSKEPSASEYTIRSKATDANSCNPATFIARRLPAPAIPSDASTLRRQFPCLPTNSTPAPHASSGKTGSPGCESQTWWLVHGPPALYRCVLVHL